MKFQKDPKDIFKELTKNFEIMFGSIENHFRPTYELLEMNCDEMNF